MRKDPFAVAVVRSGVSVSQQLTTNNRVRVRSVCKSARTSIARGGGRIRLGVANRIHSLRKLFPQNFVKGQSVKNLSLENLAILWWEELSILRWEELV